MEENEIEVLSKTSKLEEISAILKSFIKANESCFNFPSLSGERNKRVLLWAAIFQHLQNKELQAAHAHCLIAIRILSRDKTDIDNILCEKWVTVLIEKAGLYNFSNENDSVISLNDSEKEMVLEAMKTLCNIAYNSEVARAILANANVAQCVMSRLKVYKNDPFREVIMMFDLKLLFVLTALREDIKEKIRDEYHGMEYFTGYLHDIVVESRNETGETACNTDGDNGKYCFITDSKQIVACEILKAQFNLLLQSGQDLLQKPVNNAETALYEKLMSALLGLITAKTSTEDKRIDLQNNIVNLLVGIPTVYYPHLSPELKNGETSKYMFDGKNMDAMKALLQMLEHKFNVTSESGKIYDNLAPIFSVLIKCARSSPYQRKYLRQEVLPPLRDVKNPPEMGKELRNQCCKLLTTPVVAVRDLVAEFLFVLCKEKVGRMIKYTGFGNAAGHLAQNGMLCSVNRVDYSSSSEDSDTEEYLEARDKIDPVVGCMRPKKPCSFSEMTEEQKEYEAMKLVNLFDEMVTRGAVKPARIGPDGKPQPIDHVLQFLDDKSMTSADKAKEKSLEKTSSDEAE